MAYVKPDSKKDYALILGASSGFGEAVALELAGQGFNIIGIHMDRGSGLAKVEQITNQIKDQGVEAIYFNVNAASEKNRQQVIQRCQDHFKIKNITAKVKVLLHSLAFGSLAPYGVTVNSIRAGVSFTPALRKIPGHETMIDLALSQIPFKRLTQPADIAKFIAAQATSDENWATGNVFNLDGGEISVAFHTPLAK